MVLLTLVAVTAMQSVGTILIVAMLITPAATAYLYANSLKTMIFISATVGASSSLLGLFIGYSFNIAAGSSIVLTAAFLFVISFLISPKQKFLRKKRESYDEKMGSSTGKSGDFDCSFYIRGMFNK